MKRTCVYNPYRTKVRKGCKAIADKVKDMKEKRRHHYRITDPVRFFLFVLISIMIIVFAGYSVIGASDAEASAVRTYAQVVIQDGDNLWSIVERYNPDANIDIRDVIYEIYEINDIDADDIMPGDTIFVPIY